MHAFQHHVTERSHEMSRGTGSGRLSADFGSVGFCNIRSRLLNAYLLYLVVLFQCPPNIMTYEILLSLFSPLSLHKYKMSHYAYLLL